jgi:hypothetical protein
MRSIIENKKSFGNEKFYQCFLAEADSGITYRSFFSLFLPVHKRKEFSIRGGKSFQRKTCL